MAKAKHLDEAQVAVPISTHIKATAIKKKLRAKLEYSVTFREVFSMAIDCLDDAQKGGAWLNPASSWALMQDRVESSTAAVIVAMVHRYQPGASVRMGFDRVREEINIEVDGTPFVIKSVDKSHAAKTEN